MSAIPNKYIKAAAKHKDIANIQKGHGDNEAAHELQDKIMQKFIAEIARGKYEPSESAEIAAFIIKHVIRVKYVRWYS